VGFLFYKIPKSLLLGIL